TGGLLRIREALYRLRCPPSGQGWHRTSNLLFVRQALSHVELLAPSGPGGSRTLEPPPRLPHLPLRRGCFAELSAIRPWEIRDKESNLDLHVQSVASCRLDDPGKGG